MSSRVVLQLVHAEQNELPPVCPSSVCLRQTSASAFIFLSCGHACTLQAIAAVQAPEPSALPEIDRERTRSLSPEQQAAANTLASMEMVPADAAGPVTDAAPQPGELNTRGKRGVCTHSQWLDACLHVMPLVVRVKPTAGCLLYLARFTGIYNRILHCRDQMDCQCINIT